MYNLAKLLIDEPHKLERLIILFLKLLITLHVTGLIFGYDLSVGSIIENPIPKTASAIQIIYFFVVVTAAWFVLWSVIGELLLYDVLIGLLSRLGSDRDIFIGAMSFVGVASEKNGRLTPKTNIISFANSLNDSDEDTSLVDSQSRIKEYYLLTVISYVVLLASSNSMHLSKAEVIIGAILVLNFIIASIAITKFNSYMGENLDLIQREFQPLAYGQKIMNAIKEIKLFQNFESPSKGRKIVLKRKTGNETMPETLKILPAFHWNEHLGQEMILQMLHARRMKNLSADTYDILLTNISPTADIASAVRSQDNLAYIHAQDEKEIYLGMEEWIHLTTQRSRSVTPQIESQQE